MSYRYRSSDSEDKAKLIVYGFLLALMGVYYLWFYAVEVKGTGTVESKWTQTGSCSENNCSTVYLIQMEDGRIFNFLWGSRDWDRIPEGATINFVARGRNFNLLGWRVAQPAIINFEVIADKD